MSHMDNIPLEEAPPLAELALSKAAHTLRFDFEEESRLPIVTNVYGQAFEEYAQGRFDSPPFFAG